MAVRSVARKMSLVGVVAGLLGFAGGATLARRPHNLLEGAHYPARAYSLSLKDKAVGRCAVGNVELGLVPEESFPSARMDCMILNWSGPIYTFTDTKENPDPKTQLKFPVDAVYVRVDDQRGTTEVTDIIPGIRPGDGATRPPKKESQLVILFEGGRAKEIRVGDTLATRQLSFNIPVPQ